jgi:hypothetical protein
MAYGFDRRRLLRGAGGIALALPVLEGLGARPARAAAVRRFVLSYGGISTGTSKDELVPDVIGRGYDVKRALKPLTDMSLRDDVSVVSGLVIPWSASDAEPVPPGGRSRFFHFNTVGPQVAGTATPAARNGRPRGPTADQIVASAIGGPAAKVLAYRMQAVTSGGDSASMSWKPAAGGAVVRVDAVASPKLAYQSLFAGFTAPTDGAGAADTARLQLLLDQRRSVLDFVRVETSSLLARLGQADRVRLQQHLDEIRGLESRLTAAPTAAPRSCKQPAAPGDDPPTAKYAIPTPFNNEDQRADLLTDLIAMAFACDLSRVATFLLTEWKCWLNGKSFTGIDSDIHELTHGAGPLSSVSDSVAWLVRQWSKLVAKLKALPDPAGGTLLDSTALVLLFEGGHGADPESGGKTSPHSTENMVALIAGRAGGLKPGQHVAGRGRHPGQVVLSAMNAVGVMGGLGELTGNVPELFSMG